MIPETNIQINVRTPKRLLDIIDKIVEKKGYRNRQELILEALREFIEEQEDSA